MKANEVLKRINELEDTVEAEGLMGFTISELIVPYCEASYGIEYVLKKYPEKVEAYEEMLMAICGYGFEELFKRMEEEKEYYLNL